MLRHVECPHCGSSDGASMNPNADTPGMMKCFVCETAWVHEDYKEGAKKLLSYGIEIIACTLGKKGSYVLSRDRELEVPADKSEAIDTTGAGDVYTAGFLAGLLKELSLFECARLATRAATQSIKGYGRNSYPDKYFLNHDSESVCRI